MAACGYHRFGALLIVGWWTIDKTLIRYLRLYHKIKLDWDTVGLKV